MPRPPSAYPPAGLLHAQCASIGKMQAGLNIDDIAAVRCCGKAGHQLAVLAVLLTHPLHKAAHGGEGGSVRAVIDEDIKAIGLNGSEKCTAYPALDTVPSSCRR